MTAGRWSSPTIGFVMEIPGKSGGPHAAVDVLFGGHTEYSHDAHGNLKISLDPCFVVKGIPVRHADSRIRLRQGQRPSTVEVRIR